MTHQKGPSRTRCRIESLEPRTFLSVDLVTAVALPANPGAGYSVAMKGCALLPINTPGSGMEMWRSDGTPAGTYMLRDITPGSGSTDFSEIAAFGSRGYFAVKRADRSELWTTNGTVSGTKRVARFYGSHRSGLPRRISVLDDHVYFLRNAAPQLGEHDDTYQSIAGDSIWRTDGTAGGTEQVFSSVTSGARNVSYLSATDNSLYFIAAYPRGSSLFASDGTDAGTHVVFSPKRRASVYALTALRDSMFYIGNDRVNGTQLYQSDGTLDNTRAVMKFDVSWPDAMRRVGDSLVYYRDTFETQREHQIFAVDSRDPGHEQHIGMVRLSIPIFSVARERVYWSGFGDDDSLNVWSDRTKKTTLVASHVPYASLPIPVAGGRSLFFVGRESTSSDSQSIFASDGSRESVRAVQRDIDGYPLISINNKLLYRTEDENDVVHVFALDV